MSAIRTKPARRKRRLAAALVAAATAATLFTASGGPASASSAAPGSIAGFKDGYAVNDGLRIHYAVAGHGPALVLLHGWPETLQAWDTVAPAFTGDHTVIAVDLRGLGLSQAADSDAYGSYSALTLASDVHAVVGKLGFGDAKIDVAGHDWGGAVALAYAARYRETVAHLAVMEAPPTTDYLDLVAALPDKLWWDSFINGQQDGVAEQLVAGREKTFYGSIYTRDAAGGGGEPAPAQQKKYIAAYSRPGSTHAGFEYFRQQDTGEREVDALLAQGGRLTMPVLGLGGQYSMGAGIGTDLKKRIADDVTTVDLAGANHWVLEEQPAQVTAALKALFAR
ncbi:alpha/beta fold hydrolase [Kitasatospora viridis]|uniref:Pimeloyl-ACP methyl ester carboxylesterase n=1 Tax=Kitasatospora viridis TaxID=281105 RepID=A0A561S9E5_9ACTN|nr:alpha/beta hydrolase [Kitasatospora viridis]TWF71490.1 pimeloyl-ACP methyl ester carboxylesterase [Kitasatospora viridis]